MATTTDGVADAESPLRTHAQSFGDSGRPSTRRSLLALRWRGWILADDDLVTRRRRGIFGWRPAAPPTGQHQSNQLGD